MPKKFMDCVAANGKMGIRYPKPGYYQRSCTIGGKTTWGEVHKKKETSKSKKHGGLQG